MRKQYTPYAASDHMDALIALEETIALLLKKMQEQQRHLFHDEAEEFSSALAENPQLYEEIEELERRVSKTRVAPTPESFACRERITNLFSELQSQEVINRTLTKDKLMQYQKKVKDIRKSHKGVTSYLSPYSMADGMYFDKKK